MELTGEKRSTVDAYRAAPTEFHLLQNLGNVYWDILRDELSRIIREKKPLRPFLEAERDCIDFGLHETVVSNYTEILQTLSPPRRPFPDLKILRMGEWIEEMMNSIRGGNRRETVERDIQAATIRSSKLSEEIEGLQKLRRSIMQTQLSGNSGRSSREKQLDSLIRTDNLMHEHLQAKRAIARGAFLSAEKKRTHVSRQRELEKQQERNSRLFDSLDDKETAEKGRRLSQQIIDGYEQIIDCDETISRKSRELETLEEEQKGLSALEIETRILENIDYLKGLVKLTAKRLHLPGNSFIRDSVAYFTKSRLYSCMKRILEFDPAIFRNERVGIFGTPRVLLVPGEGSSLYDWKNNLIVVPIMPFQGNYMASVAAGMIEYRLDVDEEKKLINSYNKIPERKDIRSIFQLKSHLTKDYIAWMTSEYKGFRVLSREVRIWFDHEIAPPKNDMYTPFRLQPFFPGVVDGRTALRKIENKLSADLAENDQSDLWLGGILAFQQGKYERAVELLQALTEKNPQHRFGWYNLAQACGKTMRKPQAIAAFTEFIRLNPQSWWAAIARDHIRRLQ